MVLNSDGSKKSHQDECFEVKREYMPITGHNSIKPKVEESSVANVDLHYVGLEDDPINIKSSSGSAISSSDSCLQLEIKDKNEISGSIKTSVWGSYIPSRKRSSSKRRRGLSLVKILQRDLYYFLQDEKSSNLSRCPEEALIYFEKDQNVEIDLGSILLKPPITSTEQQSEACPLIMDNKVPYSNDAHKGSEILTNIPLTDLDALQIEYSPHMHATSEHSNVEGFKAIEENISSCSHHLGGKTSVTAKRTHDEICIQISEGIDPDPIRALKKPKEEPEEISPGLRGVSFSLHEMPNMQLSMNVNKFERPGTLAIWHEDATVI
ncbi:hypothetical protein L1049_015094 [Liquidambar formosana]|uniref:Uncharacterized protein n=1 Tax=Liquidambar formosana TaxID=63359 RepID=A0AAP0X2A2_LIQFO